MSGAETAKRLAIAKLWAAVAAAPHDETVHQKLVRFAVDNEVYLPAIEHYKAFAKAHPEHAALSAKWQKAIAGQAAAKVLARTPQEQPRGARGIRLLGAFVVAVVIVGLIVRC